MRQVYYVTKGQMSAWREICQAFAKRLNAKLLFVNDTSCGIELADGSFKHVYIDEMQEVLSNVSHR